MKSICRSRSFRIRLIAVVAVVAFLMLSVGGWGGVSSRSAASSVASPSSGHFAKTCPKVTQLTLSYNQASGDILPVWIADDAGYFTKNCLDVTVTSVGGTNGIPALVAGQTQIASIGGGEALSAAAAGTDLKYFLTLDPTFPYKLWAQSRYSASDLKGQRIGITTTVGSLYTGTVLALKKLGLAPSDVQLVPLGSVPNVNAALVAGSIAAAVSHPPDSCTFKQQGLKMLLDLAKQHVPTAQTGLAAQSSYVQQNPDVVQRVVMSVMEGLQRAEQDKAYTEQVMRKHMGLTDKSAADCTYTFYVTEAMPAIQLPTVEQLQSILPDLVKTNPAVGQVNLSSLIDQRFVKKAAQELLLAQLASKLSATQQVPRPKKHSAGSATFSGTLSPSGTLKWDLAVSKLTGPVTRIELYVGKAGQVGPAKLQVCAPCTRSGSKAVNDHALERQIKAGAAYLVVATKKNPNGEVRGQLTAKLG